jgi:hypothetical protein
MLRDEQERTAKSIGEIAADLVKANHPSSIQQVAHLSVKSLGAFVRPLNGSMTFRVSAGARLSDRRGEVAVGAPLLARSQWGAYS